MGVGLGLARDHEGDDALINGLVVRIHEFDQDFMRPSWKSIQDKRLAAGVYPMPWRIIHGYMNMADPRRHSERCRAEDRHDPQVLGAILDD
jgi:hypothetical protein